MSLNALYAATGSRPLQPQPPRRAKTEAEVTATRDAVLCNPGRAARTFMPVPEERELFPDGALRQLLRVKDVYDADLDRCVYRFGADHYTFGATNAAYIHAGAAPSLHHTGRIRVRHRHVQQASKTVLDSR